MKKKLILFDMDGTIYLGNQIFPYAKEVFEFLKKKNINYVFLTNNSSHDIEFYLNKVQNMGVDCTIDNFYSSIATTASIFVFSSYFSTRLKCGFNLLTKHSLPTT